MLVKVIIVFLCFMVLVALIGRALFPSALPRILQVHPDAGAYAALALGLQALLAALLMPAVARLLAAHF